MKIICVYHSADLDGICSAAIVNMIYRDVEFIGWDYGDVFPWDRVKDNFVIMVDLALQPFSEMIKLQECTKNLIWIDHHASAINDYEKCSIYIPGLRKTSKAACELAWEHFKNSNIPVVVELLGMYDSWRFKKENQEFQDRVLSFQYGMKALDLTPQDSRWADLFSDDITMIGDIVEDGEAIMRYEKTFSKNYLKSFGFEACFKKLKAICVNRGRCNSQSFESMWDPEKYDLMIPFVLTAEHCTVSLYSTKPEIDCSKIAKMYGGGGHVNAAGFQIGVLAFFNLFENINIFKCN